MDEFGEKDCVLLHSDGEWYEENCMEAKQFLCERQI